MWPDRVENEKIGSDEQLFYNKCKQDSFEAEHHYNNKILT